MTNPDPYSLAVAWASALTGDPDNAVFNWRFIHDQDKGVPAIKRRGTVAQIWPEACQWNAQGYGIFATVNAMDGNGDKLSNVAAIRAHVLDLDNLAAMQNLARATQHFPPPWFTVTTSPGKAHVYWPVMQQPGPVDVDGYRAVQRKLRQFYDGDKAVVDATRVLRVPGFYHRKGAPHLVTCNALPGYGVPVLPDALAASLSHVNAPDDGGGRHPLGDPDLAAPSADWAVRALEAMPVDGMTHPDFIKFTAAWKQAAWAVLDADDALQRWLQWCDRFGAESKGRDYNLKHWNSIEDSEVGWKSLLFMNPVLNAQYMFKPDGPVAAPSQQPVIPLGDGARATSDPVPVTDTRSGDLMLADDCMEYFRDCTFVTAFGKILEPKGQMLSPQQFNGRYGGPRFVINHSGQPTDEPWKAATRSIFWRIPTVDYLRFLPHEEPGMIVYDELGRSGVNTFRPAIIKRTQGDVSPFYHHLDLILPNKNDQRILLDFIAHNAKYPGHKIPWAPLIQSTEGAGKGVFKSLFQHLVGSAYFHSPNAKELVESGAKFNAWMREKLFILVDEIKTDERRDMIEVLKPMISEKEIEIQGKGHDQRKEDNYSNWTFFSNYKDAVPINQNSRRFAIFYSAIQSRADLMDREMNDHYFTWLYNWVEGEGKENLAYHFFHEYQIERGAIPMRAPVTSSHGEAIRQGRTATERAILDAVEAGLPGFKNGWISTIAAHAMLKQENCRNVTQSGLERIIEGLGYHMLGRATRAHFQEQSTMPAVLFNTDKNADPDLYGEQQGYGRF